MIYLDYNATAPLRPAVRAAMEAVSSRPLNPSSIHAAGRQAKKLLEDARVVIAAALGAFPNEVLFTASGSEANNMVLRGFADRPILVSAIEHASIAKTGALLGAAVIPVNEDGVVILDALHDRLKALNTPALVSVMLANNETGVIQPIRAIADIVHAHGGLLHCDAVQALGKMPLDWGMLGADMLTISGHKVGGPVGAAALLIRNDLPIRPLITGGGQELGRRAGTENVTAIIGFAALVKEVAHAPEAQEMARLRDWLQTELLSAASDAAVLGAHSPLLEEEARRLPNTLCISMPGVKNETQLVRFDLEEFAVSAGSACSSGRIEPSHVLLAMGVPKAIAACAIRISMGWNTKESEVKLFAESWKKIYATLSKPKAA